MQPIKFTDATPRPTKPREINLVVAFTQEILRLKSEVQQRSAALAAQQLSLQNAIEQRQTESSALYGDMRHNQEEEAPPPPSSGAEASGSLPARRVRISLGF